MTEASEPIVDNPTNAGTQQTDGNEPTSVSAGGQPTGEPQAAPAGEPNEEVQKISRLETELDRYKKFAQTLNIAPDSDLIDQVASGVITPEQALERTGVTKPPQPAAQPSTAQDRIGQILAKKASNQRVNEDDIFDLAEAVREGIGEIRQGYETSSQQQLIEKCAAVTTQVLGNDALYKETPDNIKQLETDVFLASTDYQVGAEISKLPEQQQRGYYTPQTYNYYAKKNLEDGYGKLREHWINHGRELERGGNPPSNPVVNPISTNTGSAPVTAPTERPTIDNLDARAAAYIQNQGQL